MTLRIDPLGDRLDPMTLSGELRKAELEQGQRRAEESFFRDGKISRLIVLDRFEGWERGRDWGDLRVMLAHDQDTARSAVIGEPRWRDEMLTFFGAGLRSATARYFTPHEAELAHAWQRAD